MRNLVEWFAARKGGFALVFSASPKFPGFPAGLCRKTVAAVVFTARNDSSMHPIHGDFDGCLKAPSPAFALGTRVSFFVA